MTCLSAFFENYITRVFLALLIFPFDGQLSLFLIPLHFLIVRVESRIRTVGVAGIPCKFNAVATMVVIRDMTVVCLQLNGRIIIVPYPDSAFNFKLTGVQRACVYDRVVRGHIALLSSHNVLLRVNDD